MFNQWYNNFADQAFHAPGQQQQQQSTAPPPVSSNYIKSLQK